MNIPMDYLTFGILIWNFSVVGIVSVFWHAPLRVNQMYLICISAFMVCRNLKTLVLIFPGYPSYQASRVVHLDYLGSHRYLWYDETLWSLLRIHTIIDLFAVLCPGGPLRVLVETAQERSESIPALIYSGKLITLLIFLLPSTELFYILSSSLSLFYPRLLCAINFPLPLWLLLAL